ncbi:hypothetical protein AB0C65_38650 [Nocardia sp. NPDC048505]|uniref:hypothetical protein n=1 Tax=Nocardia sp. NPDC048505 TaxID=3155756 RepID=UPI0033C872AD
MEVLNVLGVAVLVVGFVFTMAGEETGALRRSRPVQRFLVPLIAAGSTLVAVSVPAINLAPWEEAATGLFCSGLAVAFGGWTVSMWWQAAMKR